MFDRSRESLNLYEILSINCEEAKFCELPSIVIRIKKKVKLIFKICIV
jgi:hypothetical protein